MSFRLAQREVALAAIALLAGVIVFAFASPHARSDAASLPQPVHWYTALAAPYGPSNRHTKTACGTPLTAETLGVAHPVLPCGAKLFISFQGREVLTQVVDKGPSVPGREFDLTKALADKLGLHGVQRIRWAFAR